MTAFSRQMSLTTQREPDSKCCMPRIYSYLIPRQQIKPTEWQSDKNPCNVDIIYVILIFYVLCIKLTLKKKRKKWLETQPVKSAHLGTETVMSAHLGAQSW